MLCVQIIRTSECLPTSDYGVTGPKNGVRVRPDHTYDASDRLTAENRYAGLYPTGSPGGSATQTTTYGWTFTQQTSKAVAKPSVSTVTQAMSYGLTGQLEKVITTTQNGTGTVTARTQVQYRYDAAGIRFIAIDTTDTNLGTVAVDGSSTGRVEYLIDHDNFTGYAQTIIETTKNASLQTTKRVSYTIGLDEITQTSSTINPTTGAVTASATHTFGHDGHGSTRVLFDAAAAIAQIYLYSAYGELLAIQNSTGVVQPLTSNLTNLLYNGESLDGRTGLYNFRARWYAAGNGRFERLDPFSGNLSDPLSFHKYGFAHANPVMGTDPSGLFGDFSISGLLGNINIQGNMRSIQMGPTLNTLNTANNVRKAVRAYQNVLKLINKIEDLYSTINDVLDILSFDPGDLKDIFAQISGQLAVTTILAGKREANISLPKKALQKFKDLSNRVFALSPVANWATEVIGEYGMAVVAGGLGFEPASAKWKKSASGTGIDQVTYNDTLNIFGVFEAKGGTSRLSTLSDGTKQMSHKWIRDRLLEIIAINSDSMRDKLKGHHQFNRPMIAMVVKVNLLDTNHQIKIEAQPYSSTNVPPMVDWTVDK